MAKTPKQTSAGKPGKEPLRVKIGVGFDEAMSIIAKAPKPAQPARKPLKNSGKRDG